MKLRRCPNMHYYDEDKYAQCPHCAAADPAVNVIKESAPPPSQKTPLPIQPALPVTPPRPEEMWRCSCGTVNSGKYCVQCGSPGPLAEPRAPEAPAPAVTGKWNCACGQENEGKFCFRCGSPRPAPVQEPVSEPEIPSEETPEASPETHTETEDEKSLTSAIEEVSFTGTIEDAKEKAAENDDDGVTRIIFDELADDLVLGWLVAANTGIKGKIFTVSETSVTVGRSDPEHPVTVDLHGDRAVSRGAQAVIVYDPLNKKFFIRSAGGKTPVYVNRQMLLAPAELSAYDIILLGTTELVFVPLCSQKFSW